MTWSIRWKLIASIGLPLVLTYVGMLGWDYVTLRKEAISSVQGRVTDRAEDYADKINAQLHSVMVLADSAATFLGTRSEVSEFQMRPLLMNNLRLNPLVFASWIAIVPPGDTSNAADQPPAGPEGNDMRGPLQQRPPGVPEDWRPGDPLPPDIADRIQRQRERERQQRRALPKHSAWMLMRAPGGAVRNGEMTDDYQVTEWFADPRDSDKPHWYGPLQTPHFQKQQVCIYSVPFKQDEAFKGVVVVAVRVQDLQNLLQPPAPPAIMLRGRAAPANNHDQPAKPKPAPAPVVRGESAGATSDEAAAGTDTDASTSGAMDPDQPPYVLIDATGRILSTPRGAPPDEKNVFELAREHDEPMVAEALERAVNGRTAIARIENLRTMDPNAPSSLPEWIAFAPVSATGWVFATATPEAKLIDPILHRLAGRALFLLQGLGLMVAVVLFASIRIVRPIERMAAAVDDLAAGNLDAKIDDVKNRDEIGRLARGFNTMLTQLRSHIDQLTAQSAMREKVESEMRIARKIQTDLLPRVFPPFPDRKDFDLHGVNVPARSVAGDFFDYFFNDDGRLTLVVADVSGKGVPAAILMAVTRTIVRNLATAGLPVVEIARRANDQLMRDSTPGMFVTLWLGQYDPATGELAYVNAGHPLPYCFGPDSTPRPCGRVTGPLLGVESADVIGPIEQDVVILGKGESILLYTDGVTEARSPDDRMLRDRGVQAMLSHYAKEDPPRVCLGILRTLEKFQASHRHDDVTLVVLRRNA